MHAVPGGMGCFGRRDRISDKRANDLPDCFAGAPAACISPPGALAHRRACRPSTDELSDIVSDYFDSNRGPEHRESNRDTYVRTDLLTHPTPEVENHDSYNQKM